MGNRPTSDNASRDSSDYSSTTDTDPVNPTLPGEDSSRPPVTASGDTTHCLVRHRPKHYLLVLSPYTSPPGPPSSPVGSPKIRRHDFRPDRSPVRHFGSATGWTLRTESDPPVALNSSKKSTRTRRVFRDDRLSRPVFTTIEGRTSGLPFLPNPTQPFTESLVLRPKVGEG